MVTQDQSCPGIDVLSRPEVVVWSGLRLGRHVNVDIISWSRVNQKAYQWRCFVTIQCPPLNPWTDRYLGSLRFGDKGGTGVLGQYTFFGWLLYLVLPMSREGRLTIHSGGDTAC